MQFGGGEVALQGENGNNTMTRVTKQNNKATLKLKLSQCETEVAFWKLQSVVIKCQNKLIRRSFLGS